MPLVTDLEQVKQRAAEQHDTFEVMRYLLELNDDLSDEAIDALVDRVAQPIIDAIDCTACANCCRSLDVCLTSDDAARLASGVDIPIDTILTDFVDYERAASLDEWGVFRAQPCAFLRGTLCSVYAHRPESCRVYPQFTPDFRWTLAHTIEGASGCPIIYNVLTALVPLVDKL